MRRTLRSNSGQSLIIALSVMFILVFLGTIFVTLIARNLRGAIHSGEVLTARQMAEAGIQYADRMLTYSEEGADWRPDPASLSPAAYPDHPDIKWLRPYAPAAVGATGAGPTGGFSSFTSGSGRFLLRVTYNPDPTDPWSRYIKIESIGRSGFVDSNFMGSGTPDPTTFATSGPVRLRHELTAFKPIAITDYVRFVTNKDKRSGAATLGHSVGGEPLRFGGRVGGQERTGPIRVNGDLRWRGPVQIQLRGVSADAGEVIPVDRVEVAGEIIHDDGPDAATQVTVNTNTGGPYDAIPTRQSGNLRDDFDTFGGYYRDGVNTPDQQGYARAVKRLEPPLVDQEDPSSGNTRYRQLTLGSGRWARLRGRYTNSGRYGYGRGIYIDNSRDSQSEGSSLFGGGRTLATEWTDPDNRGNWRGPYYVPPGAVMRINPDRTLTITRTDTTRGSRVYDWHSYDPASNTLTPGLGATANFPYPENGVVFAEGNIRISGTVAKNTQLTIVSDENIYIEGSVMKEDSDTSAVALLARKNVVVNTTQFMSVPPLSTASASIWESIDGVGPPWAYRVQTSPSSHFRSNFAFGLWYRPDTIQAADAYPGGLRLLLRHASGGATASINLFLNGEPYEFLPNVYNYLMPDPVTQWAPAREGQGFNLGLGISGPAVDVNPTVLNTLEIGLNQTGLEQSRGDYLLEAIAVVPMDVNIQALLYAQEGSFFVIPGAWFNSNPEDNRSAPGGRPAYVKDPHFPFYGEPMDIKITIEGAIAENWPAAEGDVDRWMRHWSNIPETHGSSGNPTAHPGEGISFIYDPILGFPVGPGGPIRVDAFNRPLPAVPKLPVSPDLIYVGRMTG